MKNLKLLLKFMKGNSFIYIAAIVAISISSIFGTIIPLVIRTTIDSVIGDRPASLPFGLAALFEKTGGREYFSSKLWMVCIVLVSLTILNGIFMYMKGKLAALASENSGKRIRENIYNHIIHLPYEYHVKAQTGDLIQRCTSDVETVQNFVSGHMIEVVQILLQFSYVFAMMLVLDVKYTLVSILFIPFILILTFRFFVKMKEVFMKTEESEGRLSSTLQENLTGIRVVKAFGAQNFEVEKFDKRNAEYRDNISDIIYLMSNFWSRSDFMCLLQYCIVLVAGVYWAVGGHTTLGTVVAFSTYAGMLIWPVRAMGQIMAFMGQAFVSLGRIQEILDEPMEKMDEEGLKPEIKGEVEFKDVYFEYEDEKPVLQGVSFKIQKGQTIAILGSTGSGKSSLVHLLLRFYDYKKGSVKIDGIELKDIDKKWLRKNIGIVLQEPFLFSKTIKENIKLGKWDVHDEDIYRASSMAAIHDTIQRFERGYDTLIGERGVTLSGGQRQRLAIARTIIRDVPILIFDDSLSAVDVETDAAIRNALKEKSKDITTIIISHRITTLAEADQILVLENGRITQRGTHEELLRQEGLYKRVWTIQNSIENDCMAV